MSRKIHAKLGEFYATAICGNDILSSALYVSGIAALFAGIYAPIALLLVAGVLFFYRTVYREVVEALPMNGGAYNALLNGTSKVYASMAGVMTVLSYIATAVISAKTAVAYLAYFLVQFFAAHHVGITADMVDPWINPIVIVILFLFALLVISGVSESAKIAAGIFGFHVLTLVAFIVIGFLTVMHGTAAVDTANLFATGELVAKNGGLIPTLFFAFSASLLGVSGFESSANFVEEQSRGVFPKTLRNMAAGVLVFNPLIAFVVLKTMTLPAIGNAKDFLLGAAALQFGGMSFLGWIGVDAFLVLCGAVLTSFVGVSGLVNRMAMDGCLPSALVKENSRGSHPRIIFAFFALCTSILLLTGGELLSLAGVYTISFLSVMTLFALGNLILRKSREDLKRPYIAPLPAVIIAALATGAGILGNILLDPKNVVFFLTYFIPAITLTLAVIYKKDLFRSLKHFFRHWPMAHRFFLHQLYKAEQEQIFVFIHEPSRLAAMLTYIHRNESAERVTVVHCQPRDPECTSEIDSLVAGLQRAGFYPHIDIRTICLQEPFSADLLDRFAKRFRIGKNKIFMGQIHEEHPFTYEELGGVRIIW